MYRITIEKEDGEKIVEQVEGKCTLGRGEKNKIVLADAIVSTKHATVREKDGALFLSDENSKNGTFVNGERLEGEMEIAPETEIKIGPYQIRIEPLAKKTAEKPWIERLARALTRPVDPRRNPISVPESFFSASAERNDGLRGVR